MTVLRFLRLVAAALLAAQLGSAIAADTIRLAVLGPMSGPFALQGEERLKIFQASADIVNARSGVLGGRKNRNRRV